MMFRLIGGVVVYGFALYGAVQLIDRSRRDRLSKVGIGKQGDGNAGELTMDTAAGLETGELADSAGETVRTPKSVLARVAS